MRDQHRSKQELLNELTDLRKQVLDLKQAAVERRRVEDGLRHDRELLRTLLDQSPSPLCLATLAGAPLVANRAFLTLLGYGSIGELVRIGGDLGLVVGTPVGANGQSSLHIRELTFRRGDGASAVLPAVCAVVPGTEYLSIAFATNPQPA